MWIVKYIHLIVHLMWIHTCRLDSLLYSKLQARPTVNCHHLCHVILFFATFVLLLSVDDVNQIISLTVAALRCVYSLWAWAKNKVILKDSSVMPCTRSEKRERTILLCTILRALRVDRKFIHGYQTKWVRWIEYVYKYTRSILLIKCEWLYAYDNL